MTDIKFEILELAYSNGYRHVKNSDLLRESGERINQTKYAISELIYLGFLKEASHGSDYLVLTDKGAAEFESECEIRHLKAEEDARFSKTYKFNRNTTMISIAVAIVASVAAIVEAAILIYINCFAK